MELQRVGHYWATSLIKILIIYVCWFFTLHLYQIYWLVSTDVLCNLQNFLYIKACHLQIKPVLLLPFQFWWLLFLFLAWLLWLGLSELCWTGIVRVSTLISFWSYEKNFQPFSNEYNVNCGHHIRPLLRWGII